MMPKQPTVPTPNSVMEKPLRREPLSFPARKGALSPARLVAVIKPCSCGTTGKDGRPPMPLI